MVEKNANSLAYLPNKSISTSIVIFLVYFIKYCSYLIVTVLDFEDRGRSRLLEFEKKIVLVI